MAAALAVVIATSSPAENVAPAPTANKLTIEEAGRLLTTGRAALEDGLYPLASRRLDELVAKAPDRRRQAEGALWLARVRLAQARPAEALELLEAHKDNAAAALKGGFLLSRAQAQADLEQWSEMVAGLEDGREVWGRQEYVAAALRLMVRGHAAQGNWDGARTAAGELEAAHPEADDAPAAWLDLAAALDAVGQAAEARQVLERVEAAHGDTVWGQRATLKLLEWHLAQDGREDALRRLEQLTANQNLQAETRAQGFRIMALALGVESNDAAGLEMIEKAIAAAEDPAQLLEARLVKARLLMDSGKVEEGAGLSRQVAARVPDSARAARIQLELADQMARLERWDAAAAEYQVWLDAFEGAEDTAGVLARGGDALWRADRFAEAAGFFERAVARAAHDDQRNDWLVRLADARFAAGQFPQAAVAYAAVLADMPPEMPDGERIQFRLAETELALGATEAGEIRLLEISRAKKATDYSRAAAMRLGALHEERGVFESAIEQYSRVVDTGRDLPVCAEALLARGLVHYRAGSFQAALDDFSRVGADYADSPSAARAMFMRGWALYLLEQDEEALSVCREFLIAFPESEYVPHVEFRLGEYAFNHGDYEQAGEWFLRLAKEYPDDALAPEALFWAGRAATARRDYLVANECFNTLMAQYPDAERLPETLLAQGDVLSELGQFPAAILAFNEVIVRFPRSAEAMVAWGRKGDCQYTLGQDNPARYEEALLSYRTLQDNPRAPADLRLQAGYKIGRSLEKMGRPVAALDHYMEAAYAYLQAAEPPPEATVWFSRAAFAAAALQERAGKWQEAVGIYERVADSGVPTAQEARRRMERIRREQWSSF
ncbi:MAG: tetratricopeptide repeat protein [Lentisphaerae bacterium]|jgi:TolA-binding protein|nr:tetratricopeptide repeat protein [Lentisphaerota bacterium]